MAIDRSPPAPQSIATYVEEGARIAAILLVWGVVGTVAAAIGSALLAATLGLDPAIVVPGIWTLFLLTGVFNAALYVLFRGIDYHAA